MRICGYHGKSSAVLCAAGPCCGAPRAPRTSEQVRPPCLRPSSLFAALLVKEHLRLNYRGLEELLRISGQLHRLFGFLSVPDHSTFWWFARRWLNAELVAPALAETVRRVKRDDQRCQVALDSTGLWLSQTSRYFEWRAKRERGQRGWLKWALAMWVGPQMLLAQRVRPGPAGDFPDLVPLATDASAVMTFDEVIADAGYDREANHRFCRETLGVYSLIPAKKRRSIKVIATTPYRQRWKVETVMSVAKRRWG